MKNILKIISSVIIFGLLVFAFPASAHVLKTDGDIGAVLHVDPNDDPVAGETATFMFELKDRTGKFTQQNCDCSAHILENRKEIFSINLSTLTFTYNFPSRAVYTVQLIGKSTNGSFQNFTLTYDVRVDKIANGNNNGNVSGGVSRNGWYVIIGAGVLVGVILYWKSSKEK